MRWVQERFGIFEFQDEEEDELYYGKVNKAEDGLLVIDMILADGSMETNYDYSYVLEQIRVITFRQ